MQAEKYAEDNMRLYNLANMALFNYKKFVQMKLDLMSKFNNLDSKPLCNEIFNRYISLLESEEQYCSSIFDAAIASSFEGSIYLMEMPYDSKIIGYSNLMNSDKEMLIPEDALDEFLGDLNYVKYFKFSNPCCNLIANFVYHKFIPQYCSSNKQGFFVARCDVFYLANSLFKKNLSYEMILKLITNYVASVEAGCWISGKNIISNCGLPDCVIKEIAPLFELYCRQHIIFETNSTVILNK